MWTSHSIAQFPEYQKVELKTELARKCTINKALAFGSPRICQDKSKAKKKRSECY